MKHKPILTLILCCIILTAFPGCAAEKELVFSGTVEYTQYDTVSEAAGMITEVAHAEGDTVHEGDIIARIDPSLQQTNEAQAEALVKAKETRLAELKAGSRAEQIDQAEAALKAAQAKYDDLRKGPSSAQVKQARASADAAGAAKATAKATYDYAKGKYDEALAAFGAGTITQGQLNEAKLAMVTALGQYNAAKAQHNAALAQISQLKSGASADAIKGAKAGMEQAQAQLDLLKNGSTSYTVQEAQSDLDAANAQLEQARLLLARCDIKAHATGILSIANVTKGDMVNTGGYIATIADKNDVWLHVYIPQSKLKLLSVGQKLSLRTPAWPGKTFTGWVASIADEAQFTPKNVQTNEAKENTVFKVKIRIDDASHALRAGMTMDAVIPVQ